MSEENEYLLKYFFLYGVSEDIKQKLKLNAFNQNNKITPVLLSSYSAEGKSNLFQMIEKELNNNEYLRDNIFPKKANFLSDVYFPENLNEFPSLEITTNPFNQYIHAVNSFDQIPEHFSHCFQFFFKMDEDSDNNILLNFSVLIFYENVTNEYELLKEKETSWRAYFFNSKYYNTYVPKALILVSDLPIFNLMHQILENLYNTLKMKYTYFPIEQIIINFFDIMNNENIIQKKLKLYKEPILPYCDLNISFFFNLFNSKDLFLLAEYYLCSKDIIIASNCLEFLFPIYYILMTLFFPLNNNNETTFYKLVTPEEKILQSTLFSNMVPTFEFIYTEEKLDDNLLNNICKIKNEVLVYQIIKNNQNDKMHDIGIFKTIYKMEDKNGEEIVNKINIEITKYETIIEKICKFSFDIKDYLIPLIKNDIEEIKKEYNNKNPSFFGNSFVKNKKYETLRNHLIGLFIKFFVLRLKPIEVIKNEGGKIDIKNMDFNPLENDYDANDLLKTLYTTPQSDLIYKNKIVKTGLFDNPVIKKIILCDYFIKISLIDQKRTYFEPKLLQSLNKEEENNKKKDLNKEIIKEKNNDIKKKNKDKDIIFDINELFDYSINLNNDRNYFYYINRIYLYSLQNPDKSYITISQGRYYIKHLQYYSELTKIDRTKEIDKILKFNALKYMIFFGENLELHFGQFINKNIPKLDLYESIQSSEYEYVSQNKNYEQYYRATLDEAEIFYDLFITQIIPVENREELAACAIALYVLIYIINLMSELNSKNPHNKEIKEIITKKQVKLYKLLVKTKGFYGKFDFLVTLLYQVISSRQIKEKEGQNKFAEVVMNCLFKERVFPSIIIILMNNHNISMDFRVLKKNIEKNSKIKKNIKNQTVTLSENSKSFYQNYEPIKEILIYKIERKPHEHEYDLLSGINDDYNCKEKCGEVLGFQMKIKNDDKNFVDDFVINPRYIIVKLLKKIVDNKSLFVHSYNNLNDIFQIVMLDELYFKIGFFKFKEKSQNK